MAPAPALGAPIGQLLGRDWRAANPGANHLAGDHDLHAPVLLPSACSVIGSHRIAFAEAFRRDRTCRHPFLGQIIANRVAASFG